MIGIWQSPSASCLLWRPPPICARSPGCHAETAEEFHACWRKPETVVAGNCGNDLYEVRLMKRDRIGVAAGNLARRIEQQNQNGDFMVTQQ